jgi:hypothetical protein
MKRLLGAVSSLALSGALLLSPTGPAAAQMSGHWDSRQCGGWHDGDRVCIRALEHGTQGHCVTTAVRVSIDVTGPSNGSTQNLNDKALSFTSFYSQSHRVLGGHSLWKRSNGFVYRTFDVANEVGAGVNILINNATIHFYWYPDATTGVLTDSHPCS